MKNNKDEKIQVLLSSEDYLKLKNLIIKRSLIEGKLLTTSSYVREIIELHIRDNDKEQKSFVKDTIDKIIEENKK